MGQKPRAVREQAVVYLSSRDRELLERLAEETGLSRTEIFRRGLYRLADEMLVERSPGASLDYLIGIAGEAPEAPADVSERHDHYLYGGGYLERSVPKRARPR